jgi:TonB family protein
MKSHPDIDCYARRLIPFFVVSMILHASIIWGTATIRNINKTSSEQGKISIGREVYTDAISHPGFKDSGGTGNLLEGNKVYNVSYLSVLKVDSPSPAGKNNFAITNPNPGTTMIAESLQEQLREKRDRESDNMAANPDTLIMQAGIINLNKLVLLDGMLREKGETGLHSSNGGIALNVPNGDGSGSSDSGFGHIGQSGSGDQVVIIRNEDNTDKGKKPIPSENLQSKIELKNDKENDILKARDAYYREILNQIDDNKIYPMSARMNAKEGKVKVGFKVHKDGSVSEIRIIESSNFEPFDFAAIDAVKSAAPFKPVPDALDTDELNLSFDLVFRMKTV